MVPYRQVLLALQHVARRQHLVRRVDGASPRPTPPAVHPHPLRLDLLTASAIPSDSALNRSELSFTFSIIFSWDGSYPCGYCIPDPRSGHHPSG